MNNVINWSEIPVADMDRAVAFYEPVMQVTLRRETMDCAELAVFRIRIRPPAARWPNLRVSPLQRRALLFTCIQTIPATPDRIASAGGACVFGPLTLPNDIGTIALFTDSEGNRVGLHQPA